MAQIISCGSTTILHEFPSFKPLWECENVDKIKNDIQMFGVKKLFVQYAKGPDLQFYRIKENDEIQDYKKMRVNDVTCLATPKVKNSKEFAVGHSTGDIRILDLTQNVVHKYNADSPKNSVNFLELSYCNDYLSSVYEDGRINVYGLKTNIKVNNINSDKKNIPTFTRFHPCKKLQLFVGAYTGNVRLFDLQTKRVIFENSDAHEEPCMDGCMSANQPECVFTTGYDGFINVFDLRKKSLACKIGENRPAKTLAISDCGQFLSCGDLRGEIICYDLRNIKMVLNCCKIYNTEISKVAFLPISEDKTESSPITLNPTKRLSIVDYIENMSTPEKNLEDSFFSDISAFRHKKFDNCSPTTRISFGSRLSIEPRKSLFDPQPYLLCDSSDDMINVSSRRSLKSKNENCVNVENEPSDISYMNINMERHTKKAKKRNRLSNLMTITSGNDFDELAEEKWEEVDKENIFLKPAPAQSTHVDEIDTVMQSNDNEHFNIQSTVKQILDKMDSLTICINTMNQKIEKLQDIADTFQSSIKKSEQAIEFNLEMNSVQNFANNFNLVYNAEQRILETLNNKISQLQNIKEN